MVRRHRYAVASRLRRRRGQTVVITALMFVVLFGFAALALDAGRLYLVFRNAQNAADAAALAAGKRMAGGVRTAPPSSSNDPAVTAAHDWAASDGFATIRATTCDLTTLTQFTTVWYDVPGVTPCGAGTGFNVSVAIYAPPQTLTSDCQSAPYNCLQVVITQRVQNYLMGVLGQPVSTITSSASVFAEVSGAALSVPPPTGLTLYQPQAGCGGLGQQCFSEALLPQRSQLSCAAGANCPTFWVQPGTHPVIIGLDGSLLASPADITAMQSNGDMVVQDATTICDPYTNVTCVAGSAVGAKGFALSAGSTLYCSSSTPAVLAPIPCKTPGPGAAALGTLSGNETTPFTMPTWQAIVDTSKVTDCLAGLVLNGDQVKNSFVGGHNLACEPKSTEAYVIQPGKYPFIVVNHGLYAFESGVFDITGTAPVNTNLAGTYANGIDHSGEGPADWDLCPTPAVGACPTLTAGIWIGHGTLLAAAGQVSTAGSCDGGGPPPLQGGGGDATQITSTGAVFRFEPAAGGFVSTHEVTSIHLAAPGLGAMPQTAGVPLLFDLENNSFIHLDASAAANTFSSFNGLIYQTISAKAGGVEINPGLGGTAPAAVGQLLAYSFTTFGSPGAPLNFNQGTGAATTPIVTTSGNDEPEILTGAALVDPKKAGFERVVVTYDDEWKLDAYTAYIKVNNSSPVFFSQGIWSPAPSPSEPLPPANNNPGDLFPSLPNPAIPAAANYTKTGAGKADWTMTYPDKSTFEVQGDWMWGHEQDLPGSQDGINQATLTYTFPIPSGTVVNVTVFMADGDSCGDFAIATFTFNNIGSPAPGQQTIGTVHLVQ